MYVCMYVKISFNYFYILLYPSIFLFLYPSIIFISFYILQFFYFYILQLSFKYPSIISGALVDCSKTVPDRHFIAKLNKCVLINVL